MASISALKRQVKGIQPACSYVFIGEGEPVPELRKGEKLVILADNPEDFI